MLKKWSDTILPEAARSLMAFFKQWPSKTAMQLAIPSPTSTTRPVVRPLAYSEEEAGVPI